MMEGCMYHHRFNFYVHSKLCNSVIFKLLLAVFLVAAFCSFAGESFENWGKNSKGAGLHRGRKIQVVSYDPVSRQVTPALDMNGLIPARLEV